MRSTDFKSGCTSYVKESVELMQTTRAAFEKIAG